ncbi:MAG: ABC transporter permease [Hespellia sp.]|nr:ABC transporter permease [Hespellia sp.]
MNKFQKLKSKNGNELILLVIFVALFILMSILSPGKFLSVTNLQTMAFQMPEFGLMAIAMMIAVLTKGINLSIITGSTLASIIAGYFMTTEFAQNNAVVAVILAVCISLLIAALTGVINGTIIAYIGVAPMLVTLGTKMLFEGLGLQFTKGGSVSGFPLLFGEIGNGSVAGIPYTIIIYAVIVVLSYFLFERSKWGTEVYMIGCNETATRFSGINTKRVLMKVYIYSGVMAGISGILISSRYCSAKTDYGSSYLMQALTAVVLGGTSIAGGFGTVAGTVIAVGIVQVISTGLNVFGINRYIINIITGGILIAVLIIRYVSGKISDQKKIKARNAEAQKAA